MTKTSRVTAVGILLAAAATLPTSGCDKVQEAQKGLCCSDFTVGADLSGVDFEADANFQAFAQAAADFAGVAASITTDLTNACRLIAVDLGEDPNSVKDTDPPARMKAWCAKATAKIEAEVKAQGSITVEVQPPYCTANVQAQASCEAKCTADVSCEAELGNVEARCDPGELSVKCEGTCSGSCEGSANVAVSCTGTCEGTCEGTCNGTCSGNTATGTNCNGVCEGECSGKCRGSCTVAAAANVECEGECKGSCTGEATAPKCTGELTPPSAKCQGSAECSGSCEASASAKVECKEPSVNVVATGTVSAQAVASLEANLPKIMAVFKVRGAQLQASATALVDIGGKLDPGSLSGRAAACLIPIINAVGQALENSKASLEVSASIAGTIGVS